MDIILSLHTYFESNFGFHYPTELIYFIVELYQKLSQWKISCGISHNFLLNNNEIYSWGSNSFYQLGLNHDQNYKTPQKVKYDFADIVCGTNFSIGRTNSMEIYIWGRLVNQTYTKPTKIDLNNVKKIFCGSYHCFALTDESVYVWGINDYGQLGLGTTYKNKSEPQKLNLKSIIEIVCGCFHSIAFGADESIYVWGYNKRGQLGLGHNSNQSLPQKLDFIGCISMSAGDSHTLALTIKGEIYSCGNNDEGQLGLKNVKSLNLFQKIELENIRAVYCKGNHSVCLTSDNEIYAWGRQYGSYPRCHNSPQKIKLIGVKEIGCGYGYVVIVTFKNEVYTWGNNSDIPQRLLIE